MASSSRSDHTQQPSRKKVILVKGCVDYESDKMIEIFYNLAADTSLRFVDGKVIRISKALLYNEVRSELIYQTLFCPLKEDEIIITDIDSDTFKLFLDCVMGFKSTKRQSALKIFPVVWKYQIEKWVNKCIEILMPKEMNTEVCLTLNMAVLYNCDVLIDRILDFILFETSPYELLENNNFLLLLEPESLCKIVKEIDLDSVIIKIMFDWGLNYLGNNYPKFTSLKNLFKYYKIMDQIKFKDFMTTDELYKFATANSTKYFYSYREMFLGMRSESLEHNKSSEWKYIKGGDSLTEEFTIHLQSFVYPILFLYNVELNNVACYNTPVGKSGQLFESKAVINEKYEQHLGVESGLLAKRKHWKYQLKLLLNLRQSEANMNKIKIKLTHTFKYDCRLLMVSKPENCCDCGDRTYFVKRISLLTVGS